MKKVFHDLWDLKGKNFIRGTRKMKGKTKFILWIFILPNLSMLLGCIVSSLIPPPFNASIEEMWVLFPIFNVVILIWFGMLASLGK